MNIEIKGLILWGIFTNNITLLHLSCQELFINHSPVSDELWIPKMHDGIIKLQKQEKKWSSRVKTPKWGSLEQEPKSFEDTQRYQWIGGQHATTEKYPRNLKCQTSHETEKPLKGSTLIVQILQAKISCPELFKPISVCFDVCQNAMFRTLKKHWICLKFTKTKIFSWCSIVKNSWAKPKKNFHTSHF